MSGPPDGAARCCVRGRLWPDSKPGEQAGACRRRPQDGLLTAPLPRGRFGAGFAGDGVGAFVGLRDGLGRGADGRGRVRIAGAFVLAGAKTLAPSLWKAPDEQTRELMEDFYRRILAGEPRAEALRQAQLEMKKKYPDPFYSRRVHLSGRSRAVAGASLKEKAAAISKSPQNQPPAI